MGNTTVPGEVRLQTERLVLRGWRVEDAALQRELWTERDPRVPAHRRIDSDGRPTVAELERGIRADRTSPPGLLALELVSTGEVIGYCGLVHHESAVGDPELAFELLRRHWGRGYATEAATAVLYWAKATGYRRVNASVWNWNHASRRVLAKLGFTEAWERAEDPHSPISLVTTLQL